MHASEYFDWPLVLSSLCKNNCNLIYVSESFLIFGFILCYVPRMVHCTDYNVELCLHKLDLMISDINADSLENCK